jgi:hypothetical protein
MKKTKELMEFENLMAKRLSPEKPQHASHVHLRGVSSDFIGLVNRLYKDHSSKKQEGCVNPTIMKKNDK